ncbi:MAG TPA: phage tail protein [Symbiobacteriaceae bacterium]|nr:phage tail protein [Symbiobacteriaceae bacterium]
MTRGRWWGGIVVTVLAVAVLLAGQGPVRQAQAAESKAGVQLFIDGRMVASFQEVSGLGMELTVDEAVCRVDGKDDDCDGLATEAWQAEVLTALWQLSAAADELERGAWAASRGRHETAKNAIGNIRGLVVQTQGTLQDAGQSLKTRHDTVKNAIGNIRAAVRAVSTVTAEQEGFDQTQVRAMQAAANTLTGLAGGYRHVYRPGRPVYGNITLRGAVGTVPASSLPEWFREGTERKSGSIVILDNSGKEARRYNLFECWPVRFATSQMAEEIEFAVERVEPAR